MNTTQLQVQLLKLANCRLKFRPKKAQLILAIMLALTGSAVDAGQIVPGIDAGPGPVDPRSARSPISYEGIISPAVPVAGSVDGSACGICGANGIAGLDFWSFIATNGDIVTISGARIDLNFDHSFSLFSGATSADESTTAGHLFFQNSFDTMTFLAFADDQVPHPGPFGDPLLSNFVIPASGIYTIVVGAASSQVAPNSQYSLTVVGHSGIPEPSTLALAGLGLSFIALRRKR
jgi:hypothetical protein